MGDTTMANKGIILLVYSATAVKPVVNKIYVHRVFCARARPVIVRSRIKIKGQVSGK